MGGSNLRVILVEATVLCLAVGGCAGRRRPGVEAARAPRAEVVVVSAGAQPTVVGGVAWRLVLRGHKHGKGFTLGRYAIIGKRGTLREEERFEVSSPLDWYGELKLLGKIVQLRGKTERGLQIQLRPAGASSNPLSEDALDGLLEKAKGTGALARSLAALAARGRRPSGSASTERAGARAVELRDRAGRALLDVVIGAWTGEILYFGPRRGVR